MMSFEREKRENKRHGQQDRDLTRTTSFPFPFPHRPAWLAAWTPSLTPQRQGAVGTTLVSCQGRALCDGGIGRKPGGLGRRMGS